MAVRRRRGGRPACGPLPRARPRRRADGRRARASRRPAGVPPPARLLAWRGGENMTTSTGAAELRAEVVELAAERDALRAQLDGDLPAATRWLQRKVWRQAAALDGLNRRGVTQRFVLRALAGLAPAPAPAEDRGAPPPAGARPPPGRRRAGHPPLKRPRAGSTPAWGTIAAPHCAPP